MKIFRKAFILLLIGCMSVSSFAACGSVTESNGGDGTMTHSSLDSSDGGIEYEDCIITAVDYDVVEMSLSEIDAWSTENNLDNRAYKTDGIVRSPYFKMSANGVNVPVYAERTARGVHNIAYINVDGISENGKFLLDLELTTHEERTNPIVLPESAGVQASVDGKTVTATITEYGSYSFTFDRDKTGIVNDGSKIPLTVMVKEKEKLNVPDGWNTQTFEPGSYPIDLLTFEEENTVYVFKRGRYDIDGIRIKANNVYVYFEDGATLFAKPLTMNGEIPAVNDIISCGNKSNVKFIGRPAIDFSYRSGENNTRLMFSFEFCEDLEFAGVNSVNSAGWTCCFTNCKDVLIRDLVLIAFRTYTDGVMLSDCQDVVVTGCFNRTGDDSMEVKSTSAGSMKTDNVIFEYNAVWTDKGIAYGAVYESNHDQRNVTWRHNSVGFALAQWTEHLACTTVCVHGNVSTVVNEDLHFEDIEIYQTYCAVTTICMHKGGTVRNIYFKNIEAKYISLNQDIFRGPIDLIVRNEDNGDIGDFSIKNLYFDNIVVEGKRLTNDNKEEMITNRFVDDFGFRYAYIRVDTLLDKS